MEFHQIYLDANATSSLRPAARGVLRAFSEDFEGVKNPSSVHSQGQRARALLKKAREDILKLLFRGETSLPVPAEIFFTSGATEGCNALVFGFRDTASVPRHILTSAIEHPAMLEPIRLLELRGSSVSRVRPESNSILNVEKFVGELQKETDLVTVMAANNETGALQPVAEIARAVRAAGYSGPILCDYTQALGKTRISAAELFRSGVTALAISGHKIGAPAGIGAVVLNRAPEEMCFIFNPRILGGAQNEGRRAGTENLIGAMAFGEVARELALTLDDELIALADLREKLWGSLRRSLPETQRISPDGESSLANTLSVRFPGVRGDDLVVALDLLGVCSSTGSACASGKQGVSHVIEALGLSKSEAREVVRFSLDWNTTEYDIRNAVDRIVRAVSQVNGTATAPHPPLSVRKHARKYFNFR